MIEPAVFLKRLTRTEITAVKQVICICWKIKKCKIVKRNEPSVRRTFERFIVNRHEYEVLIDVTLRGSISYTRATSRRAFRFAVFFLQNTASLYRLPILFRKKSRSAQLFACKRPHYVSLSLFGTQIDFKVLPPVVEA